MCIKRSRSFWDPDPVTQGYYWTEEKWTILGIPCSSNSSKCLLLWSLKRWFWPQQVSHGAATNASCAIVWHRNADFLGDTINPPLLIPGGLFIGVVEHKCKYTSTNTNTNTQTHKHILRDSSNPCSYQGRQSLVLAKWTEGIACTSIISFKMPVWWV